MTIKERLIKEVDQAPDALLEQVLNFLQFLKLSYQQEDQEPLLLSESSLNKDWLSPEEDKAWADL